MKLQFVRLKMCGMTNLPDIIEAAQLGADAIGLIFYPKSTRYVSVDKAKSLLNTLPLFMDVVAVFVNPSVEEVSEVIETLPIQWLQFHGEESPAFCEQFQMNYIKAVPAINAQQIKEVAAMYQSAGAILLDTPSTERGGTGCTFDWSVVPKQCAKPIILAGGLTPENVADAIEKVKPQAVDVCSGIERMPGFKDHEKMKHFVNQMSG